MTISSDSRPHIGRANKKSEHFTKGTMLERAKGGGAGSPIPWPSHGDTGTGEPAILDGQPALGSRDWLPNGVFPEIDKLREEHHAALDAIQEIAGRRSELEDQYTNEDQARDAALLEGEQPPTVTTTAERTDALELVEAERKAAVARLGATVERAIGTFAAMQDEWDQRLAKRAAEAEEKRAKAQELLAEAEREVQATTQIENFVTRTVSPRGGRFITAPEELPTEAVAA